MLAIPFRGHAIIYTILPLHLNRFFGMLHIRGRIIGVIRLPTNI